MVIPDALKDKILDWYHHYLQYPGHDRLEATINATMTWKELKDSVQRYTKKCSKCQKNKHTKNSLENSQRNCVKRNLGTRYVSI